jgi:hypothetical protein
VLLVFFNNCEKLGSTPGSSTQTESPWPSNNLTTPRNTFQDEFGTEFAPLTSRSLSSKILSYPNGNVYALAVNSKSILSCSDVWTFKEEALIADGSSRSLHYSSNTMSVLSVSRLRVEDESTILAVALLLPGHHMVRLLMRLSM